MADDTMLATEQAAVVVAALANQVLDQERAIRELTRARDAALRALEEERASLPKPGVWLVEESSGWSGRWIAVADTPDPLAVAAIERHRVAMVGAVLRALSGTTTTGVDGAEQRVMPSAWAIVDAVIAACGEGSGA